MHYVSVCSGIESATVAWAPLGWSPLWFAETERFPSALLAQRYPHVVNRGDVTRYAEWPDAVVDVLVGGTPCQSFSLAGLRAGMDDPRGALLVAYLAVARRFRPRWLVWENVPGVLSIDDGRAFGALLGGLAELGYMGSWRVLDAQYFGLAQRRARVFVVGHHRDWRRGAAVLFERASLSGHPAPRRHAGQSAGAAAAGGAAGDDADGAVSRGDLAGACSAKWAKGTGGPAGDECYNLVTEDVPATWRRCADCEEFWCELHGQHAFECPCPPIEEWPVDPYACAVVADPIATNQARTYTREGTHNFRLSNVVQAGRRIRRLTPRECERLQGFPDDYTLIRFRGRPAADAPRYTALGNAMAVPVMRWIGERIAQVEALA